MAQILVLDDDRVFLETLCDVLEVAGHACKPAVSLADAFSLLKSQPIELVLTDYSLQHESGLTLIEGMKGRPEHEAIPIIMITGTPDPAVKAAAEQFGAFATLSKPLDFDYLLESIRHALGSSGAN